MGKFGPNGQSTQQFIRIANTAFSQESCTASVLGSGSLVVNWGDSDIKPSLEANAKLIRRTPDDPFKLCAVSLGFDDEATEFTVSLGQSYDYSERFSNIRNSYFADPISVEIFDYFNEYFSGQVTIVNTPTPKWLGAKLLQLSSVKKAVMMIGHNQINPLKT